jgi:hypothetical protein
MLVTTTFAPFVTFGYGGYNQTNVGYDTCCEPAVRCDGVPMGIMGEKECGTAVNRALIFNFDAHTSGFNRTQGQLYAWSGFAGEMAPNFIPMGGAEVVTAKFTSFAAERFPVLGQDVGRWFGQSPQNLSTWQDFLPQAQRILNDTKAQYGNVDAYAMAAPNAAAEGEEAAALRAYSEDGGHHIPAKSAFTGDPAYDANAALAIPNSELAAQGISHSAVTGAQQTLYRAYAQTGQPLTWEAMQSIETQALVRGGMSPGSASATVNNAINALKASGVSGPTRIPWGGN